jgi:hypothetical protein
VLRDDFRPDGDVDVLVEFEPGTVPGLAFFAMQDELPQLFKREDDGHRLKPTPDMGNPLKRVGVGPLPTRLNGLGIPDAE